MVTFLAYSKKKGGRTRVRTPPKNHLDNLDPPKRYAEISETPIYMQPQKSRTNKTAKSVFGQPQGSESLDPEP